MDTSGVIQLIVLFILIFLSGFFSSAETALTTVNRVKMRTLADEGSKRTATVNKIIERYSKMLSAVLIGNNIVNLSASSLATTFVIRQWGNAYVGVATGVLTLIVLLCGEILPKNWARLNSEKISLAYAGIIYGLMKLLTPVIFVVDALANGILHLLHMDANGKNDTITENELKTYVDASHEDGEIESEERELIYNVFEFSDTCAKDIMIPRVNMVTVSTKDSSKELLAIFKESLYTRIPVYDEDKDCMVGFINIKDFFLARDNARDEYDDDEKELIQKVGDRSYLIEGSMNLSDINDVIGTELDSEDYDSIGGIIIGQLNRLPEDDETVTLEDGTTLQVKGLEQNRIVHVLLTLPPKEDPAATDETSEHKETEAD